MKIHYKTIINKGTDYINLFGKEKYVAVRTTKNIYSPLKIDYCCNEMQNAVTSNVIYVQEVGSSMDKTGISLFLNEQDRYEDCMTVWYYHPLKFCPFCSEKITLVEDYKANEVTRKVHIPSKTIPARNEIRIHEIKIK